MPAQVISVIDPPGPDEGDRDLALRLTTAESGIVQASIGAPLRPIRMSCIGDSISSIPSLWHVWAPLLSGGRIISLPLNAGGVGGNTTTQMLARIASITGAAIKPDVIVVLGGTNDLGGAVASATTKANLNAMYDAIEAAGIEPIACLIPPRDNYANELPPLNTWIASNAYSRSMRVVDMYTSLADPDGTWKSGYSDDGVHPTTVIGRAMGLLAANEILRNRNVSTVIPWLAQSVADSSNMLTNGVFSGDANTDGVADNWTLSGAAAPAITAPSASDIIGNWQSETVSVAGQRYFNQALSGSISTGDILFVGCRIKMSSIASGFNISLLLNGWTSILYQLSSGTVSEDDTAIFSALLNVGASIPTSFRVLGSTTGTGKFEIAQVAVRNLTALGLA